MKQFKIAMIGCGGVTTMHFDGYANHQDRIHISAACDLDPQRVKSMALTKALTRSKR
jgi:predicted dehydrogenase